jgi:hypothetical protein
MPADAARATTDEILMRSDWQRLEDSAIAYSNATPPPFPPRSEGTPSNVPTSLRLVVTDASTTLTYPVSRLIEDDVDPSDIRTFTFPNKASREILSRIAGWRDHRRPRSCCRFGRTLSGVGREAHVEERWWTSNGREQDVSWNPRGRRHRLHERLGTPPPDGGQLLSPPACHAGGREFESRRPWPTSERRS